MLGVTWQLQSLVQVRVPIGFLRKGLQAERRPVGRLRGKLENEVRSPCKWCCQGQGGRGGIHDFQRHTAGDLYSCSRKATGCMSEAQVVAAWESFQEPRVTTSPLRVL